MKRTLAIIVVLVIALTGVFASGAKEKEGGTDPLCGTWFGGGPDSDTIGYKYQYTFIPTGPDRWFALAQGIYEPVALGAAIMSQWTGEVQRIDGTYEIRIMSMFITNPANPPEEYPVVHAIRGWLTVHSENEIGTSYDLWGAYAWDTTPYVDEPAVWMLPFGSPAITEVLHRLRMDVELP